VTSMPPGWYPDPEGGASSRWWDGTMWGPSAPAPPVGPPGGFQGPPAGPPPSSPAKKRKKWPWIAGGVVALLVIAAIAGGGGDDDDGDDRASDTTSSDTDVDVTEDDDTGGTTEAPDVADTDLDVTTPPAEEATTASTAPETTTTEASEIGTRENPIALGTVQRVGGWNLRVLSFTENANDLVAAANQFNEPPPPGEQFVLTMIEATYDGEDESQSLLFQIGFAYLGDSNVQVDVLSGTSCGVVGGDEAAYTEVFRGGTIQVPICFSLTPEDAATIRLSAEEQFSLDPDDHPFYFAVR
jgi:hypothetical protein